MSLFNQNEFKSEVVGQIGYNKVCENTDVKLDTPALSKCAREFISLSLP